MRISLLIAVFFLCLCANAQKPAKPGTQGEAENDWAKEIFTKNYSKHTYPAYGKKIDVNLSEYTFGSDLIILKDHHVVTSHAFFRGLLYPDLFKGDFLILDLKNFKKERKDSAIKKDTFYIGAIDELASLEPSAKVKRFRCYISSPRVSNPVAFMFEFTNPKAGQKTSMEDFITGATLTFFRKGWLGI